MSRPIMLTEEIKKQIKDEFSESLDKAKMSDGKLSYSKTFNYTDSKATVLLTFEAHKKIVALLTNFADEVGWHGTVSRLSDNEFVIEDVLVYPQEVTGSTVNTDQEMYTKWLYERDDEVFDKIRMQGHSHVNMGVSPSSVDNNHRKKILEQLDKNMFYIFMIWNKSLTYHTLIYDMENNILYEDKDVEVKLLVDDGVEEFLNDAKEKVQKLDNRKTAKKLVVKPKIEVDEDLAEHGYYPHYQQAFFDKYDLGGSLWQL